MQSVESTHYSLSDDAPPPPCAGSAEPQGRDGERLLSLYRVGSLLVEDRRELCLIKNISAGGMMIRAYSAIAQGAAVKVELKCGEPISGHATWIRGANVGVSFDAPIDVIDILTASLDRPRPRMPRLEIDTMVTVRDGARLYRLRARDISQGGLKVDCAEALPPHTEVVVSLPGLDPEPAVVRWSVGTQRGIAFNRLVNLSRLVEWLQQRRPANNDG